MSELPVHQTLGMIPRLVQLEGGTASLSAMADLSSKPCTTDAVHPALLAHAIRASIDSEASLKRSVTMGCLLAVMEPAGFHFFQACCNLIRIFRVCTLEPIFEPACPSLYLEASIPGGERRSLYSILKGHVCESEPVFRKISNKGRDSSKQADSHHSGT